MAPRLTVIGTEATHGDNEGFRKHLLRLRESLEAAGASIEADAPTVLHVVTPLAFHPRAGCRNVLVTHWETDALSEHQVEMVSQADLVITAATWCSEVFRAHLPAHVPVETVSLGVDRHFTPSLRTTPHQRPFRFLALSAPNPRKGIEHLVSAWDSSGLPEIDELELYIKTTRADGGPGEVTRAGNVIFDSRRVPAADLVRIYRDAHAFVYPSLGEGFGLTLAEAMSTGLPAAYVHHAGVKDFGAGIQIPFVMHRLPVYQRDELVVEGSMAVPTANGLVLALGLMRQGYQVQRRAGFAAGKKLYGRLTWENTARGVLAALERHCAPLAEAA